MGHDDAVLVAWPDVGGVAIVALLLLLLLLVLLLGESIAGCCAGVEEGTDDVALVRPIVRSLDASSMVAIKAYVLLCFASAKKGARRTLSSSGAIAIIFIYRCLGSLLPFQVLINN